MYPHKKCIYIVIESNLKIFIKKIHSTFSPGVYSPEKSTKRFFKRKHNFGGRSHLLGSVQIRCLPEQMDT